MKKLFKKNKILQQFLADGTLLDETVMIPDYYFTDSCMMAPFYILIQAIKALSFSDLYYTRTLLEDLSTYKAELMTEKLALALLCMEDNELERASKYLKELEPYFIGRPNAHRFYLRAQDDVYRADFKMFMKWFPLANMRLVIYSERTGEDVRNSIKKYSELAIAAGVEKIWVDRFELKSRMSYYRKTRNISAQEKEINFLLQQYENEISRLNTKSSIQRKNISKQILFIVQQMFQVIEQYELSLQHNKTLFWCDQILLLQPKSQKSIVTKIETLKKLKRYQCALGFCNAFIVNNPKDSIGYYLRSNTYFLMKEKRKALQDAQDCYQKSSDRKSGLIARGFSLLNLEEYNKAAGCFEAVCLMGNPSYEALRGLGKAYASMDLTIKSLECYMQCKKIDPVDIDLIHDIADVQFMGGYFNEAKKSAIACIKQNHRFTGAYVILGMIALREENEPLAMEYFNKTLQFDANNPYALNEKGFLCHLAGDDEQALELIDRALCEFPEYADALSNKGMIHCMSNDFEDAYICFDKALRITPEHLSASLGKASVLLHEEKTQEALLAFESIIKSYPANEEARSGMETAMKLLGLANE